ncbi:hypothetical protein AALO_G00043400 [Alosa alosa]|uniref:Beta/gamma crystallin 'Greek key' domain-containing protein n=1 Tax=Alosa alosa TaxID=278164 RepID=A0AAV6H8S4_9TELE|nr:hypothetical protein AALO_G00043400 [Alosa alosa]
MINDRSNFMGNQYFMKRGKYSDYMRMMGMRDCIRSCRMIAMHRGQFRKRIYEKENAQADGGLCHVMDGHWLMYEQPHFRGRMMYMRPGEYISFREMGMSNMRFQSMRRIMDSCL